MMMTTSRWLAVPVALLALFPAHAGAQAPGAKKASADRIMADVRYLADDAREGRGVGTAGLDSAAAYIARQFEAAGLKPGTAKGFFQSFPVNHDAPALAHCGIKPSVIKNVVGVAPGRGKLAGQVVVIGAHYDGLGMGGCGSLDPDSLNAVHNGADDNASGTAGVMEVARLLRERLTGTTDRRTIVFVAFTGEELGILGSSHYVSNAPYPIDSTKAMLNLDMVGRMQDNRLQAMGTLTAVELNAVLDSVNATYKLALSAGGDGYGSSDHAAFAVARVPVLHFFTGIHQDYHRTTDDYQKIDPAGEATVTAFIADVAWKLASRPSPVTYVSLPLPQAASSGTGYGNASLGTLPDMASPPGGVRIQGVRGGSAAEIAGLKAGDILVKIGGRETPDLQEMTKALQEHQPGDTVDVVFKRNDVRITVKAVLQKRG